MALNLDTNSMLRELDSIGVSVDGTIGASAEEQYNHIIHMYDVFFLKDYKFAQETAEICCTHKINKQPWQKAYRA